VPVDAPLRGRRHLGGLAQAEQAGVTLSCLPASPSLSILADADRLHQCLVNLLTNAVKYNRRGGWARIDLAGDAQHVDRRPRQRPGLHAPSANACSSRSIASAGSRRPCPARAWAS
jgi:hypothetical protein